MDFPEFSQFDFDMGWATIADLSFSCFPNIAESSNVTQYTHHNK